MNTEPQNHMALVGLRLLALLLAMLWGALGFIVLITFGFNKEAMRTIIIAVLIGWAVAPDKAARIAYMDFQRQRIGGKDE